MILRLRPRLRYRRARVRKQQQRHGRGRCGRHHCPAVDFDHLSLLTGVVRVCDVMAIDCACGNGARIGW
jgi:hypothetical protein